MPKRASHSSNAPARAKAEGIILGAGSLVEHRSIAEPTCREVILRLTDRDFGELVRQSMRAGQTPGKYAEGLVAGGVAGSLTLDDGPVQAAIAENADLRERNGRLADQLATLRARFDQVKLEAAERQRELGVLRAAQPAPSAFSEAEIAQARADIAELEAGRETIAGLKADVAMLRQAAEIAEAELAGLKPELALHVDNARALGAENSSLRDEAERLAAEVALLRAKPAVHVQAEANLSPATRAALSEMIAAAVAAGLAARQGEPEAVNGSVNAETTVAAPAPAPAYGLCATARREAPQTNEAPLSKSFVKIVVGYHWANTPVAQIARMMGCPEAQVRRALAAAGKSP